LYARTVRLDKRHARFQLRRTQKLETHMSASLLSFPVRAMPAGIDADTEILTSVLCNEVHMEHMNYMRK
jgi:hypothetical protein